MTIESILNCISLFIQIHSLFLTRLLFLVPSVDLIRQQEKPKTCRFPLERVSYPPFLQNRVGYKSPCLSSHPHRSCLKSKIIKHHQKSLEIYINRPCFQNSSPFFTMFHHVFRVTTPPSPPSPAFPRRRGQRVAVLWAQHLLALPQGAAAERLRLLEELQGDPWCGEISMARKDRNRQIYGQI